MDDSMQGQSVWCSFRFSDFFPKPEDFERLRDADLLYGFALMQLAYFREHLEGSDIGKFLQVAPPEDMTCEDVLYRIAKIIEKGDLARYTRFYNRDHLIPIYFETDDPSYIDEEDDEEDEDVDFALIEFLEQMAQPFFATEEDIAFYHEKYHDPRYAWQNTPSPQDLELIDLLTPKPTALAYAHQATASQASAYQAPVPQLSATQSYASHEATASQGLEAQQPVAQEASSSWIPAPQGSEAQEPIGQQPQVYASQEATQLAPSSLEASESQVSATQAYSSLDVTAFQESVAQQPIAQESAASLVPATQGLEALQPVAQETSASWEASTQGSVGQEAIAQQPQVYASQETTLQDPSSLESSESQVSATQAYASHDVTALQEPVAQQPAAQEASASWASASQGSKVQESIAQQPQVYASQETVPLAPSSLEASVPQVSATQSYASQEATASQGLEAQQPTAQETSASWVPAPQSSVGQEPIGQQPQVYASQAYASQDVSASQGLVAQQPAPQETSASWGASTQGSEAQEPIGQQPQVYASQEATQLAPSSLEASESQVSATQAYASQEAPATQGLEAQQPVAQETSASWVASTQGTDAQEAIAQQPQVYASQEATQLAPSSLEASVLQMSSTQEVAPQASAPQVSVSQASAPQDSASQAQATEASAVQAPVTQVAATKASVSSEAPKPQAPAAQPAPATLASAAPEPVAQASVPQAQVASAPAPKALDSSEAPAPQESATKEPVDLSAQAPQAPVSQEAVAQSVPTSQASAPQEVPVPYVDIRKLPSTQEAVFKMLEVLIASSQLTKARLAPNTSVPDSSAPQAAVSSESASKEPSSSSQNPTDSASASQTPAAPDTPAPKAPDPQYVAENHAQVLQELPAPKSVEGETGAAATKDAAGAKDASGAQSAAGTAGKASGAGAGVAAAGSAAAAGAPSWKYKLRGRSMSQKLEEAAFAMAAEYGPSDYLIPSDAYAPAFVDYTKSGLKPYLVKVPTDVKALLFTVSYPSILKIDVAAEAGLTPKKITLEDIDLEETSEHAALFFLCQARYRKWYFDKHRFSKLNGAERELFFKLRELSKRDYAKRLLARYEREFGSDVSAIQSGLEKVIDDIRSALFKEKASDSYLQKFYPLLFGVNMPEGVELFGNGDLNWRFDYFENSKDDFEPREPLPRSDEMWPSVKAPARDSHGRVQQKAMHMPSLSFSTDELDTKLRLKEHGYEDGLGSLLLEPLLARYECPSPFVELFSFVPFVTEFVDLSWGNLTDAVNVLRQTLLILRSREFVLEGEWYALYQNPAADMLVRVLGRALMQVPASGDAAGAGAGADAGSCAGSAMELQKRASYIALERLCHLTFASSLAQRGLSVDNLASDERFKLELQRAKDNAAMLFHYEQNAVYYLGSILGFRVTSDLTLPGSMYRFLLTAHVNKSYDKNSVQPLPIVDGVEKPEELFLEPLRRLHNERVAIKKSLRQRELLRDNFSHSHNDTERLFDKACLKGFKGKDKAKTVWEQYQPPEGVSEEELMRELNIKSLRVQLQLSPAAPHLFWMHDLSELKFYLQDNFNELPHQNLLTVPEPWPNISPEYKSLLERLKILTYKIHFYELYMQYWKGIIEQLQDVDDAGDYHWMYSHPLRQLVTQVKGTFLYQLSAEMSSSDCKARSLLETLRLGVWSLILQPEDKGMPISRLYERSNVVFGCDNDWPMFDWENIRSHLEPQATVPDSSVVAAGAGAGAAASSSSFAAAGATGVDSGAEDAADEIFDLQALHEAISAQENEDAAAKDKLKATEAEASQSSKRKDTKDQSAKTRRKRKSSSLSLLGVIEGDENEAEAKASAKSKRPSKTLQEAAPVSAAQIASVSSGAASAGEPSASDGGAEAESKSEVKDSVVDSDASQSD